MHELGITQNIVAIASDRAQGAQVRDITLEIGQLSGVMADAIRFCFEVCAEGTPVAGAKLTIIETPGLGRCQVCDQDVPLEVPFGVCQCGSTHLDIVQGEELRIKALEIETSEVAA